MVCDVLPPSYLHILHLPPSRYHYYYLPSPISLKLSAKHHTTPQLISEPLRNHILSIPRTHTHLPASLIFLLSHLIHPRPRMPDTAQIQPLPLDYQNTNSSTSRLQWRGFPASTTIYPSPITRTYKPLIFLSAYQSAW
jgi:hypothetical protein